MRMVDGIGEPEFSVVGSALTAECSLASNVVSCRGQELLVRTGGRGGMCEVEGLLVKFEVGRMLGVREVVKKPAGQRPLAWIPADEWTDEQVKSRMRGGSVEEFVARLRDAQEAVSVHKGRTQFVADPSFYSGQEAAVSHEVEGSRLVVRVALDGPGKDATSGIRVVGYRKRWVQVDQRFWAAYGYAIKVGYVVDGADAMLETMLTDYADRAAVMKDLVNDVYAAAMGMSLDEWRSGRVAKAEPTEPTEKKFVRKRGSKKKGRETLKKRKALGYWYDEKGKRLPKEERDRRKAELERAQEVSE